MILNIGIICFAVLTLFHLVTLPVEFDASRRAKRELASLGIIAPGEEKGVNETLEKYRRIADAALNPRPRFLQVRRNIR